MSKYKVGDKVYIRADLVLRQMYGSNSVNESMMTHQGKVATIVTAGGRDAYAIDLDNRRWVWTDEMFLDRPMDIVLDIDGVKHTIKPEINVIQNLLTEASRGSDTPTLWILRNLDGKVITKSNIESGPLPMTIYAFRRKKEEKKI